MAYQISEKNQILLALFAIVVLCAGKLFKDYLYRGGYVEGLTVESPGSWARPTATDAADLTGITFVLNVTLGAQLTANQTITVSWPTGTGVTMSANTSSYTAVIVPVVTGASFTASPISGPTATFTLTGSLVTGSVVKISMAGATISRGNTEIKDFAFTTTTTSESTAVVTPITIQSLSQLATGQGPSAQEIRNAISIINTRLATGDTPSNTDLLNARSALVNVLAYTYGTIKEAGKVFDSNALYEAQKTAIDFIAKERKRAAANATTLSQDNTNKRRMAQVNTYYTRNYEANTEVMKNIIYVSVALIVLAVLRNKELIPASISTLGVIFILTMGGIVIGKQVFDIMRRNDHEFDKYDWNFNEDDMNNKFVQQNADPSKPMDLGMSGACYGPGCCDTGTTWDAARGLCASSGGALSITQGSMAVWTNPISPATTGTLTITMKITQALVSGNTVTITLPADVFTPASSGASIQGGASFTTVSNVNAVMLKNPIVITASAGVSNTVSITITGISVSSTAILSSRHNVIVSTSKETNPYGLRISGLPTA
jgi:hypothetical protein